MKIRVQHENGTIETIELIEPLKVHEGNWLNSIFSNDGLDHYFTQEGYYDGWGTGDPRLLSQENAENVIVEIDEMGIIEPPKEE